MPIRTYKPTSPGRRDMSTTDFSEITKTSPEKSLLGPWKRSGGRNNKGRMTIRHRGGGHKRRYRIIDFKRNKLDVPARVLGIEYDPNRSARIALIQYADGEKAYILAPIGLTDGMEVLSGDEADIKPGNSLPLSHIPLGTQIHNIELKIGKGGQLIRAAGTWGQLLAKENGYAVIRMPSGEVRQINERCRASIGQLSNPQHENRNLGKAGRRRWLGRRPKVRGVVMNPVDHPHGGGEGRAGQGNPHPVTPWGKPTKGYKTVRSKPSDKYIVKKRGRK